MDEYPFKKTKKKKIENIIFLIVIILLFLYMLFRTEIISGTRLCTTCENSEACEDVCIKYCLLRICDRVTAIGYRNNSSIYCGCICNSNVHLLVDRFL